MITLPLIGSAQLLKRLGNKAKEATTQVLERGVDQTVNKAADKTINKEIDSAFTTKKTNQSNAQSPVTPQLATFSAYDFVPGERVIYADDFMQDNLGELPLDWNSNASGVVVGTENPKGKWIQLSQGTYLAGSKSTNFGNAYTIEFDVLLNVTPKPGYYLPPLYYGAFGSGKADPADNQFLQNQRVNTSFEFKVEPKIGMPSLLSLNSYELGKRTFENERKPLQFFINTLKRVAHYAISVQGGRLRMWIDENKVIDVPRAVNASKPINQLYFRTENVGGFDDGSYSYLIGNLKVASGVPDTRSKLLTTGKFVTTGVLFPVNSDQILPVSYGVLKEIAKTLQENPDIKIKIIGHTDADGSPAANIILSKKRAEAIKNFLTKEFEIAAERLTVDGKGASMPVVDNKTATHKAANRRVEFIKL